MAIRVGYFENTTECYSEGPFVMVNASGWRIEVGHKGMKCPTLPDISIYGFLRDKGLPDSKTNDEALCACIVDYLNAKFKDGTLVNNQYGYPIWEMHEINERYKKHQAWQLKCEREAAREAASND